MRRGPVSWANAASGTYSHHRVPHLADGTVYTELGETYLDSLSKTRTSKRLVRCLEALGFRVQFEPAVA